MQQRSDGNGTVTGLLSLSFLVASSLLGCVRVDRATTYQMYVSMKYIYIYVEFFR